MLAPIVSDAAAHRQALIARARECLQAGAVAAVHAGIEPWIVRSWQRCLQAGMRPHQRVSFAPVSSAQAHDATEAHHALVTAARPVIEQLTRATAGMRYFAMLTNAYGIVVDVQGPVDRHDARARAIGRVGVDLSEAAVGTTAIGAALTELQPVWLHRGEHFCDDNAAFSCAGAPLFDPAGRCMGMLDLTGVEVPERPELRHLVARSARAIEDALVCGQAHALLLRLNWPGGALGGEGVGLMTLDAEGFVTGANTAARQMLPMPLRPPGSALHASDLFALPWTLLMDAARTQRPGVIDLPLWSGLRLQAQAHVQTAQPARASAPLPAVGTWGAAPLRETETELIRRAVQDARGNVAEAARALGISRATVYRKLGGGARKR
ncbi:helix-turn-helix domain-containing protein [Acidovorax lacteus]|uniref:DNA binding HTH domain-containing protein n=1 Tax=Acidovorax lacteus TaxID=1924988 RepID=A0ABP8L5V7_9BURK